MNIDIEEIKKKLSNMSDDELMRMVSVDRDEHLVEIVDLATQELEKRGFSDIKPKKTVINCPKCDVGLRIPENLGTVKIKCPSCGWQFLLDESHGIFYERQLSTTESHSFLNKVKNNSLAIAIGIIVVGLFVYLNLTPEEKIVPPSTSRSFHTNVKTNPKKWITISYSNLLDPNAIIRTGQTLKTALRDPYLKGAIQPFVDHFSRLLQPAIEMTFGPDSLPFRNVVDFYPEGSIQPAWVGIMRGGRINVSSDNIGHARVFLLGENPKSLYLKYQSVVRHCLNALIPPDGSELAVEVYAYENDYINSHLKLNLKPYVLYSSLLSSSKLPIDMAGLDEFFKSGAQLEGATLDRNEGLVLYGKEVSNQTIANSSVSLSDFVVAYRAVFHAGDNEAFISLDPHKDPTKVTVNFGGFLENTRVGSVVLESDKRFKTITSGLDPNSHKDIRKYTGRLIPSFMSVAEQDLLRKDFSTGGKWIETRFWFYPDSIGIETDFNYKYAIITKPQFTADAERSKEDFISPEEFEKKTKAYLSPSIRRNIDHLNNNYVDYGSAFQEIRELGVIARLMGICSWLYDAKPNWLDLDALLSVELPPFKTEMERTQLMAVSFVSYLDTDEIDDDYIKSKSKILYLTPILEQKVGDYFNNSMNVSKFICEKNGIDQQRYKIYQEEGSTIFKSNFNKQVKSIIKTKKDLTALAMYASDNIDIYPPHIVDVLIREIDNNKAMLDKLESEINIMNMNMQNAGIREYRSLVSEYNEMVDQYEILRQKYNQNLDYYNKLDVEFPQIVEIGGGINLEPRNFRIRKAFNSKKLRQFENIAEKTKYEWTIIDGKGKWIRSKTNTGVSSFQNKLPDINWISKSAIKTAKGESFEFLITELDEAYWVSTSAEGSWRDLLKSEKSKYRERSFDQKTRKLHIAEFESGNLKKYVTGQFINEDYIVFSESDRKDLMVPSIPPAWWKVKQ
jgi:hypothetical protein